MKYIVETCTADEEIISVTVSCRSDASRDYLFRKCAAGMASELYKRELISDATEWQWDLPNIWRNGAVGALWCSKPYYNCTIRREDVDCYIAC